MAPAPVKRYRLLESAHVDGELQGAGYIFARAEGDPMPERVPVLATDHVGGLGDGFEMALKSSPLFKTIDDPIHDDDPAVPLMSAMRLVKSDADNGDSGSKDEPDGTHS